MDNFYLSALVQEIMPEVRGRTVARASLEASTLLIDLRLTSGRQLLASLDRTTPALYLSSEIASQPSKGNRTSTFFLSLVRKHVVDARIVRFWKEPLDRIVHIDFEKLDAGDNKIQISLRLALTGRSANAYLADVKGNVIGMLFEQNPADRLVQSTPSIETLDPARLTRELSHSMAESEVLDHFFGAGSQFGPQLKNEFLARCKDTNPVGAFRSLIDDLFHRDPLPLLYSRLPLEQIQQVVINPKTDLLLSHIELAQARGMLRFQSSSLSEAADQYYSARAPALALRAEYAMLKQTLAREINKRESALSAIESDRSRFEHPERLKRCGDLILANLANARIEGTMVTVVDYYDPSQAEIQIEIQEGATLQEAASGYFARYQKARRALAAIALREQEVAHNLAPLKQLLSRLEQEPTGDCIAKVSRSAEQQLGITRGTRPDKGKRARGKGGYAFGRRFKSSDGYEIVVGRNDRDNDTLTFRVAKPHDIWLHAADYPGSHAIIRNPTRDIPPHRTITEAAEVAAFYSQAKREGKAAVHYAQKKFVSKPPRSKPGLVRLSAFKTILVEPRCKLERMD
ncbi:MAG TPA: NFACT family protein [Blastocatellia bacterium]|nr:NFACT family protein [Blastocatellia bacterium]